MKMVMRISTRSCVLIGAASPTARPPNWRIRTSSVLIQRKALVLTVEGLTCRYGKVTAVRRPGSSKGVIADQPNGAGKPRR